MKQQRKISSIYFRKIIAFLGFVFLSFSFVYGQNEREIEVYFEVDSVTVVKGSTFTNFLVVKNKSAEEITIEDLAPQEKYPGLLFYPKADFTLTVGEEKRLPLKFIANLDFLKMPTDKVTFTLSYNSPNISNDVEVSFTVQKEENRSIAMYPFTRENYIDPTTPGSEMIFFVENRGYSQRSIKLDFQSLPEGLEITPKQQTVTLAGLEKQMLIMKVSARRQNALNPDYTIQVKATDLVDQENVGSSHIRVVVLSSNRQIARGMESGSRNNFAEMTYNEHSSGLNYLKLRGNTEFAATENLYGRFNLNTDYYTQDGLYNLYDTWLELEHKNSILRLGNVYGTDYDYSVSGRGAKITRSFGENNEIEVLGLENNYSLYGTYFPQGKGAKMAGAKYSFGNPKSLNGKVSYLFEHDPRLSIESQVTHFTSNFTYKEQHHFKVEAGLSHERGLLNKDENAGASIKLDYDTRIGQWDFQSLNSFATKSYAGLNRGAFFFNQRIGREFSGSKRAFLQYENSQVEPGYLSFQDTQSQPGGYENYRYYFHSTQAVKLGYQFSARNWSFLFSPQILEQKSENNAIAHTLLAYRMHTNIGTSFGAHGFHLTAEYSYSKEDRSLDWFHSLRTTMSYRFKGFSLNGTAQWNPNNVIDLNSYYNGDKDFVNYNINTSYNFQALQRSLIGSVSAGINYSELYENINNNFNGNIEYKISPSWSTTGYFNYSQYKSTQTNGYSGDNYQFRVGVKKYFTVATSIGNHRVSFQLFEDENFNGILDAGERVLANEVVKLDDYIAITDKNGKVVFQNVPQGVYKIKVNESAGSRLRMDPMIVVDRNIKMDVGLVKNIRVTGKLAEIKQAYDVKETSVTGIVVYAKGEDGIVQSTVVNQNNEFEFFLKDGKYEIYIENDKYNFVHSRQTIEVGNTEDLEELLFEYKKKDTEIKVKKF